jgi:urease accessory protein
MTEARRTALLDAVREEVTGSALAASAGATTTHAQAVVLRVLAARVEPAMAILAQVRARWRALAWDLEACAPRVWRT